MLKIVQDFKDWAIFDQVMKKILTEEENEKLFKIKALGGMWAKKLQNEKCIKFCKTPWNFNPTKDNFSMECMVSPARFQCSDGATSICTVIWIVTWKLYEA